MKAVIHVIMNRSGEQGVKPCIIVKQPNQFTRGVHKPSDPVWQKVKKLVLSPGRDITGGATFFHNLTVRPSWAYKYRVTLRWGNHVFYKN